MKHNNIKTIFCLLLIISMTFSTFYISNVKGDNWLGGYSYRKYHVINPSVGAGTNYQVNVTVHYGSGIDSGADVYLNGKCRSDFGDIRFTKVDGTTLLDYWIESKTNGVNATFWVEIADDLSSVSRTIYLYYGNSGVTSTSNGDNTFIFFDDFETNLNKWTTYGSTGLRFSGSNNLGSPSGFGTVADFDGYSPFTLECWFKTTGTGTQPLIIRMNLPYQVPGGGNGRGYALFLYNGRVWVELRNSAYDPTNEILIGGNVRTVNDGNWHHVVATYDGSQTASGIHIYLDAIEESFDVSRDTLNGTISCPARFNTATYGGFYWFTGDMDEVVVYTSILSLSDAVARYNNGTGTEAIPINATVYAHWSMDEGSGTDVIDISGHPERNLWLATAGGPNPSWITGVVEAPAISTDYAFSGTKSIKIPVGDLASHVQLPYGDKAVHVRFYDEMSPLAEYAVVSTDAGEAEVSYIGLVNDIGQYEYMLQSVPYNSGITRTVGWHEFVTRSTTNLKQFVIDGNLMPNTGTGNYCPKTFLITSNTAEAPAYWDTVFITKFVNPEPTHGMWSGEDTGHILTTTILSTQSDNPSSVTIWSVVLVVVDPLTTVTQSSITVSVTSSTSTSTCTTSKQTATTTTTPSVITTCTTSKQTSVSTSTTSTSTNTCTTSKQTSITTTTTCTSTTSKSSTVATTTTTPTTSVSTSKTTTTTPTTLSATSVTTTTASTTVTPTTSISTSKTTTTTPTTSILTSKTTTTTPTSTSFVTTYQVTTSTSYSSTSVITSSVVTTCTSTPITSLVTSLTTTTATTITSCTTTPTTSVSTSKTTSTTPTTSMVTSVTTTTSTSISATITRTVASVTYTSSTTSIRSNDVGLVYGVFTATSSSIISFTAPNYTNSTTAWTWVVSINLLTTYTASQSADIPVFVSNIIDRFTLTSANTITKIYNSYTYDAIVTTSTALQSATINFGTTTTTSSTSVKSSTQSTTTCDTLTNSSTTSTTFCETSCLTESSIFSTTTCTTQVESSTESTTFCESITESSTYTFIFTKYETTCETYVTSTFTKYETISSTYVTSTGTCSTTSACETTCATGTNTRTYDPHLWTVTYITTEEPTHTMGHMEPEGTGAGNVTLTIVTTMAILNVTTTFTITTGGGMLVFGQGWSVLIIPILLFAGLVVLIVIGKKLR
jgi:hypothetical protein